MAKPIQYTALYHFIDADADLPNWVKPTLKHLIRLARRFDTTIVYPCLKKFASYANKHIHTIRRHINLLLKRGWLKQLTPRNGRNGPTRYQLTPPAPFFCAPGPTMGPVPERSVHSATQNTPDAPRRPRVSPLTRCFAIAKDHMARLARSSRELVERAYQATCQRQGLTADNMAFDISWRRLYPAPTPQHRQRQRDVTQQRGIGAYAQWSSRRPSR